MLDRMRFANHTNVAVLTPHVDFSSAIVNFVGCLLKGKVQKNRKYNAFLQCSSAAFMYSLIISLYALSSVSVAKSTKLEVES